jgi:hypothetical protein
LINITLCHLIGCNDALGAALPRPAVSPVQGWLSAGRKIVGARRYPGYTIGEFYDQGDAKWIVIRRPTLGRPVDHPGVGRPLGIFGGSSYY